MPTGGEVTAVRTGVSSKREAARGVIDFYSCGLSVSVSRCEVLHDSKFSRLGTIALSFKRYPVGNVCLIAGFVLQGNVARLLTYGSKMFQK